MSAAMTDDRHLPTRAGLAGAVSAAVALGVGELPSALGGEATSLVSVVASRFIDGFAASLKDIAVALFGANDKIALIVGIVVVGVLAGFLLGRLALRNFGWAVAGFGAFGAVGLWAGISDPQASAGGTVAGVVVGVGLGLITLAALLRLAKGLPVLPDLADDAAGPPGRLRSASTVTGVPVEPPTAEVAAATLSPTNDPRITTASRRAFLVASGTAVAGAGAAAIVSRRLRSTNVVEAARAEIELPTASTVAPAPSTGFDLPGLSPVITPNEDFYRIDTAIVVPQVDVDDWTLTINGAVDNELTFTYDDLLSRDLVERPVTIACVSNEVGGGLVGTAVWQGIPLTELLDEAGVQPGGTQIMGRSVDGFRAGFPTELAYDGRTALLAVGMNGEPLPARSGFPARLIISGIYGYVSATKWLSEIQLTDWETDHGYWIPRGWSKEGPIKVTSRIDVPKRRDELRAGTIPIGGIAFSPNKGIAAVDVRIDGGEWQPATLGESTNDDVWVQWRYDWPATAGNHVIESRATTKDGDVQIEQPSPVAPDGATGFHRVLVDVLAA